MYRTQPNREKETRKYKQQADSRKIRRNEARMTVDDSRPVRIAEYKIEVVIEDFQAPLNVQMTTGDVSSAATSI